MINLYIIPTILFLKCEGFPDAGVVSMTKRRYGFAVHFFKRLKNPQKLISDE